MANGWMAGSFAELPLPSEVSQWQEQATQEIEQSMPKSPPRKQSRRRTRKRKQSAPDDNTQHDSGNPHISTSNE